MEPNPPIAAWRRAKNLLCVRLDSLGDVLMTTPAIRALKSAGRNRRVTLLTSPAGAEAGWLVPEIDHVLCFEAPWMKATAMRLSSAPEWAFARRLRRYQFDAAVIFTVYSQNPMPAAMLCYLADIPLRVAHCRENPYQMLTHWVKECEPEQGIRHEVQRQLDLVAAVGCKSNDHRMSLRPPRGARRRIVRLLDKLGVDRRRPWLVIHPGASAPSRRYAPESFAAVARRLIVNEGFQVVFTGSSSEQELIEAVRSQARAPSFSLAGCLKLGDLAALLELAPVLISNNTGPVHVAAAVGTPVVDLYALTNPQHTPWGVPNRVLSHDVPCKYCYKSVCPEQHHHCLSLVTPQSVVEATLDVLAETGRLQPVLEPAG